MIVVTKKLMKGVFMKEKESQKSLLSSQNKYDENKISHTEIMSAEYALNTKVSN